jgi:hypothetical protein
MFQNNVEMIEHCGGVMGNDAGLMYSALAVKGLTCTVATPNKQLGYTADAGRERVLACTFVLRSIRIHYRKLLENLEDGYSVMHASSKLAHGYCHPRLLGDNDLSDSTPPEDGGTAGASGEQQQRDCTQSSWG